MDGPRATHQAEFPEVLSLTNSIFREGTDQSVETDYPWVFNVDKLAYLRILKVDGKIVCHVPVAPREVIAEDDQFMLGIISPTGTHPDYRHQGYATLCLRDCVRIMEENSWPVSALWTREQTFPFYQNSGWEAVSSQGWVYHLRGDEQEIFEPGQFEVVQFDPGKGEHLRAVMRMHEAEPYRIARSPAEYRLLFSLPKMSTFLSMRGSEVAGYLMFGQGLNKPGLIEAGGRPEALEPLVRHVLLQREPDEQVQIPVPLSSTALVDLMEAKKPGQRLPIEEAEGIGPQMMRINNLEKLLMGIKHHLQQKSAGLKGQLCLVCRESNEAVTLRYADGDIQILAGSFAQPVVLGRRQLTQLIFGHFHKDEPIRYPGHASQILQRMFPFYFPIWELDHS